MLLLSITLTVALLAVMASCDHKVCSWKPYKDSPGNHGYDLFCEAEKGATYPVEWRCGDNHIGRPNRKVADWDKLDAFTLEIGTPCGRKGYGYDDDGYCISDYWAACLNTASDGNCYYLYAKDDCEWPIAFENDQLPTYINVFFLRSYPTRRTRDAAGSLEGAANGTARDAEEVSQLDT